MDIKLPLSINLTPSKLTLPELAGLKLQVGQPLDAKVVNALISTAQNAISLKLGNQIVTVQSSQPLNLQPGQNLAVQVTKTTPALEFKVLSPLPEAKNQPILLALLPQATPVIQQLQAKIIGLTDKQIQLQVLPNTSSESPQKPIVINIDRASISLPAASSVGQQITIEISKTGKHPEYRLIANTDNPIETKIAALVKQLLPRQSPPIQLLEQLHENLPQLVSSQTLPEPLKKVVLELLQGLPQKEQLFDDQHLAKVIKDSGVFLEAKLPLLIKSGLFEGSLKEAVLNLLQKAPQQADSKPLPEAGLADTLFKSDFKANLGKLLEALKSEINNQNNLAISNAETDVLKNLQHKTENSLAKIVLDQLVSLPKEDIPKQLWHFELAFMDRETPQTAELQIQMDQEQDQATAINNWSATITITPPGLGAIHCVVNCRDKLVSTYFKTQTSQTASLIKDNLEYLKTQFEEQGLKIGLMSANEGGLPTNHASKQSQGKKLFDDHA
ncbi:MAG: flagellar hook-length control protein FliK [Methylobacter sp.]|nr:flagellar hook-length control protein FliK [Methylobacter sp.]